jgi:multidrug efflux pump subunit AcrA (membrane-fusion protein)
MALKRNKWYIVSLAIIILLVVLALIYISRRSQPIEYYVLEPRNVSETIVSTGHIASNQLLDLAFDTAGTIREVYVKEGDKVKKGEVLFAQNNDLEQIALSLLQKQVASAFGSAREHVLQAELEAEQKHREYARLEVLAESGAISQTELELAKKEELLAASNLNLARQELGKSIRRNSTALNQSSESDIQLDQARLNLERKKLRSPMDGQIFSIYQQRGEYAQPGVVVVQLANATTVVEIEMDEKQLLKTKVGQRVLVSPQADSSIILEGVISSIGTQVDKNTGTYTITCTLNSFPEILKPNSAVNTEIIVHEEARLLVIPKEYLRNISGKSELLLWNKGNPVAKAVNISRSIDDYVVVSGLEKGTILINPAQFQTGRRYYLGLAKGSD